MLLIALNNNKDSLDATESLLRANGVQDILQARRDKDKEEVDSHEWNENRHLKNIIEQSNFVNALIASLTTKQFLILHEGLKNIEKTYYKKNQGVICTLPYEQIIEIVTEKRSESIMEISKYLKAKLVCSELNAKEKKDAILELANLVKDSGQIEDFDQFISEVFEREEAMTTGIGHEIAVPHARTEAVNGLIIAFGRSKSGIEFESVDGQPVKLVLLIGASKKDMGDYLKVLAYLTRILKKDEFRQKLLEAKDPQEMIGIFQGVEKKDIQ